MRRIIWMVGLFSLVGGAAYAIRQAISGQTHRTVGASAEEAEEVGGNYWVSENPRSNYVRMHSGSCHLCRDGQGPRGGQSGLWHGPFASYTQAHDAAAATGRPFGGGTGNCRVCKPEQ